MSFVSLFRLTIVKNGLKARTHSNSHNVHLTKKLFTKARRDELWPKWKKTIKSTAIGFVPIGLSFAAVMQWRAYRARSKNRIANTFEVTCYKILPLRMVSRWWGWIADINLPTLLRPLLYGLYARTFGVNLSEAVTDDLTTYKTLADFFARPLKEGVRPIDKNYFLVAPCDGTVLHLGTVDTNHIEQVKGITYSLENFLGENTWRRNKTGHSDYRINLLHKYEDQHTLYQCVIYLAPGDYHRFHSPAEWMPTHRRHFHGELLSVNPIVVQWLPELFCINERAVYLGEWQYGFFSYTAVGATNVGNIKIYSDKTLQTNKPKSSQLTKDKYLGSNLLLKPGDPFGEFRMGSTIVLVFEGPPNFQFRVKCGDKVKMGQGLGTVYQHTFVHEAATMNDVTKR